MLNGDGPGGGERPDRALELRNVDAAYGTITVLRGVDLIVPFGQVVALLGPNGGGKSTVLRVVSGLLPVTGGDVYVAGRRVNGAAPDELARHGVCLIPEGKGIFPNLSVRENLWMATHTGRPLNDIEEIAYARFPRLGERRKQLAGTLSGGEQQMLAMARALATDPALLLLDELSMGLAPLVVEQLYEIVAQVATEGVSILVVEQFARAVLGIVDWVGIMLRGRITNFGTPAAMEAELSTAYLGE
ncbi:MAG: branched-chain amino acid transport system ATP-binding protein [Actinomycetota bacterium]|jgi:branched-chain amino acid transport system ATP-binding protein|nr:branched-chain amino acid transport system ATP-binding protein [Actinomycetota bacterium]